MFFIFHLLLFLSFFLIFVFLQFFSLFSFSYIFMDIEMYFHWFFTFFILEEAVWEEGLLPPQSSKLPLSSSPLPPQTQVPPPNWCRRQHGPVHRRVGNMCYDAQCGERFLRQMLVTGVLEQQPLESELVHAMPMFEGAADAWMSPDVEHWRQAIPAEHGGSAWKAKETYKVTRCHQGLALGCAPRCPAPARVVHRGKSVTCSVAVLLSGLQNFYGLPRTHLATKHEADGGVPTLASHPSQGQHALSTVVKVRVPGAETECLGRSH